MCTLATCGNFSHRLWCWNHKIYPKRWYFNWSYLCLHRNCRPYCCSCFQNPPLFAAPDTELRVRYSALTRFGPSGAPKGEPRPVALTGTKSETNDSTSQNSTCGWRDKSTATRKTQGNVGSSVQCTALFLMTYLSSVMAYIRKNIGRIACGIWVSHEGDYGQCCRLGCGSVQSGRLLVKIIIRLWKCRQ